MSKLELKVGQAEFEGKSYEYLYVEVDINGVIQKLKLKPYSNFERSLLIAEVKKNALSIDNVKR